MSMMVTGYLQWRRPGAEFGGDGKFFRGPRFLNYGFSWKNIDLFPFLVIDHFFRIYPFFFQIFHIFTNIYTMLNVVYDPFLTRKTTISEKNSFMTIFLLCSYFSALPTTLLLKILGDGCIGRPPPQILGGQSP